MVAVPPLPPIPVGEQRILLNGISWKDYVLMRDLLDGPYPKMTFIQGTLELMSPSTDHELWKTNIARFVELFAYLRRVDLYGYGSTTFKREAVQHGAEPDECYVVGKRMVDYPQIVLEVVHTSPLLDKLDVYRAFGVEEVWVFRDGAFAVHQLDPAAGRYQVRASSTLVPGLDFTLLARFALREDTPQALRDFAALIREA